MWQNWWCPLTGSDINLCASPANQMNACAVLHKFPWATLNLMNARVTQGLVSQVNRERVKARERKVMGLK